jgi:hypothetical protein
MDPSDCVVQTGQRWAHEGRRLTMIKVAPDSGGDCRVTFDNLTNASAQTMCSSGAWTRLP